jgi:catechol 2,3-dioxygenase-like lactoylglutathione lyase family enzyme
MDGVGVVAISHIGLCVADLGRSKRFYAEGLGFREIARFEVGREFAPVMEIAGDLVLTSVFLRRDGVSIELLGFATPAAEGEPARRPMNRLGLTHFSMLVEDVEAVAERLRALGGTVLEHTRLATPNGEFIYCLDPDGIRVELMRLASGPVGAA